MSDLISRAAAIAKVEKARKAARTLTGMDFVMMLKNQPAVDATPVIHGRWIKMVGMMPPEYHGHYECSECQWHMKGLRNSWTREEEMNYCPNCGAKMDEEV